MLVMQEDGKLGSNGFTLRGHRLLEEMILHVLRQVAPYPRNGIAQRTRKLIGDHAGSRVGGWHLGYSWLGLPDGSIGNFFGIA